MKITSLGAAKTVTGSKTLLEVGDEKILIDCGMYQGKGSGDLNHSDLGFDPREISSVFLTHGHFDHCGLLPVLVKRGFVGKIISTYPTREIARIILEDSANIQKYESGKSAEGEKSQEPLYDLLDVERTMELFTCRELGKPYAANGITYQFHEAGHILGAASLVIERDGKRICFSGDLGRGDDPLHLPPDFPKELNTLILESTYGDRVHPDLDPSAEFEKHIKRVIKTRGVLLIPSFAVARSQIVLHILARLFREKKELRLPVYFDSPMGFKATKLYQDNASLLKVSRKEFEEDLSYVKFMEFGKDLKRLEKTKGPYILISSSGMISGGRVLRHFDMLAKHENNTVLLVGYQGEGTIGRALLEKNKDIALMGHTVNVRAQVELIDSLSAHADFEEIADLIGPGEQAPAKIFLNHGEDNALNHFQKVLQERFSSEVTVMERGVEYEA